MQIKKISKSCTIHLYTFMSVIRLSIDFVGSLCLANNKAGSASFSGLVASEVRVLCDLEQPEPTW